MREQTGSFESLYNSLERDLHSSDGNALKLDVMPLPTGLFYNL